MIDLHCHLLPAIDDGAINPETSLAMARIALADGITLTACTPHIYPGLYENRNNTIQPALLQLRQTLAAAELPLGLVAGADIQLTPEMLPGLRQGTYPTLHQSRYYLLEPPHHTVPVNFIATIHDSLALGYIPVITHPERLTWLDDEHYPWFVQAAALGAWIQITAGALTGRFGRIPRYWGERFLDQGIVHILATDAHDTRHRPPVLSEGRDAAIPWVGATEADRLVNERPQAILDNQDPKNVLLPPEKDPARLTSVTKKKGWLSRLFQASAASDHSSD